MIDSRAFTLSLQTLAPSQDFHVHTYGEVEGIPLLALDRAAPSAAAPRIYLSSGIHGDEPAGPLAMQALLERNLLPRNLSFTLCPLVNPFGTDRRTRENGQGVDLNRDFLAPSQEETRSLAQHLAQQDPYQLSLCLHEDWEASGFYLYCLGNASGETVGRSMLAAAAKIGPIDLSDEIDEHPAAAGLIARGPEMDLNAIEEWPEAFLLYSKNAHTHFTTESASSRPLDERVEMHLAAVLEAINKLDSLLESANAPE